ncbi:hypothetical protein ASG92_23215 [Arthrobacter sp. Soil736]|jgi:hypothetical protein|uniref:YegP family protein n=1 Tax=Arthrobacter sp. Soil736 TaxID=1736395 RepID=UPI0006F25EBC|nr:DUF1508 domain-containing protein [Arthrobacter sp. Soil736]KRE58566.1 hypothetical protein ASG92_23215 [Arthrobacter sp. Soil736]
MAGLFELFVDAQSYVRFRLTAPDGTVMAVSRAFDDKSAAVAGIAAVREYAGMGHIADLCPADRSNPAPPHSESGQPAQAYRSVPAGETATRNRALRGDATRLPWSGAA